MQVHRVERDLSHVLDAEHDHPRYPEEKDVVAGLKDGAWVVTLEVWSFVRPPKGAERPEPGREPGVEHVGILVDVVAATRRAPRWIRPVLVGHDHRVTVPAVPHRDGVPPPDLSRDG